MSTVVALLGSESLELPPPRQLVLSVGKVVPSGQSSTAPSVKMNLLFLLFHHGGDWQRCELDAILLNVQKFLEDREGDILPRLDTH